MRGLHFLVNARLTTLSSEFLANCRPRGYLVPPAYASRSVREKVRGLPDREKRYVLVDNGLFDNLSRIRDASRTRAAALAASLKSAQVLTANCPPRAALPAAARATVDRFVAELARSVRSAAAEPLADRLSFAPDGVVGSEEILASVCFSLGLEPSFMARGAARLEAINGRVATQTSKRRASGELGRAAELPVVAALDYPGAFAAGAIYARHGIRKLCLPFGAMMADDRSASEYTGPNGRVALGSAVPARVLRAVLVASGFVRGWRSVKRSAPEHLHLLGLGQPLILALVAAALERVPLVTCDATSPFKDAASGTIYTAIPVFRRLDVGAVAANLLTGPQGVWDCPCAWCASQRARQKWAAARELFGRLPPEERSPRTLQLRRQDPLGQLLPGLCVNPDPGTLGARIGHNHVILLECIGALNRAKGRDGGLKRLASRWVKGYPEGKQANPFRRALEHALALV